MNKLLDAQQQTAVAQQSGKNAFEAYGESVSQKNIVGRLLKFSKGDYLVGENNDDFDTETQLVANMDEMLVGWIRWQDNRPTDHIMGKVSEGYQPPRRNELGDTDENQWDVDNEGERRDPWQFANYLVLKELDSDELYTFTSSSKGGLNALAELCKAYGKQMRQRPGQYPVIAFDSGSYQHPNKNYGRIKFPILEIVGWAEKSVFEGLGEASDEGAEIEEAAPLAPPEPTPTMGPAGIVAKAKAKAAAAKKPATPGPAPQQPTKF